MSDEQADPAAPAAEGSEAPSTDPPGTSAAEQPTSEDQSGTNEAAILSVLQNSKVDGGKKSAWQMTKETFGMSEGGRRQKDDVLCDTPEEAMNSLKSLYLASKSESDKKWEFSLTPLEPLNATHDDLLRAFVLWSFKEGPGNYNVSKAFRRLESYASWMEDHRKDLEEPLTVQSILEASKAWNMKLTHDKYGRLVWWIAFGEIDTEAIKSKISLQDSLRYCVWLTHVVLFDKKAQENGMVLMQSLGNKGMVATLTLVPMDLGTKLDRLTIGVLPLKMNELYLFHHGLWVSMLMGLMKPFMSKKMRERLKVVPRNTDLQVALDESVGRDTIPVGFAGLTGEVENDIIQTDFIGTVAPAEETE